jgi:hypothetical protein
MVDGEALGQLTAELGATSYHQLLTDLVQFRIAQLLSDDVTDPYVAMKRRGQVEELQRLLLPGTLQALALRGLERQHRFETVTRHEHRETGPPRDWWADPMDESHG